MSNTLEAEVGDVDITQSEVLIAVGRGREEKEHGHDRGAG